jgi:hypothetical protein
VIDHQTQENPIASEPVTSTDRKAHKTAVYNVPIEELEGKRGSYLDLALQASFAAKTLKITPSNRTIHQNDSDVTLDTRSTLRHFQLASQRVQQAKRQDFRKRPSTALHQDKTLQPC